MKTLIKIIAFALMGTSAFADNADGMKELLRVLAFEADGGTVVNQQGELVFPPALAEQPKTFEGKVRVATITTEWEENTWEEFSATSGFAYTTPPTVVEDVPIITNLFASDPKELCRTLDLPKLGRIDLVAKVREGEGGRSIVTITVIQRPQFFVIPSK